jgi:serine/threonine protein kinase
MGMAKTGEASERKERTASGVVPASSDLGAAKDGGEIRSGVVLNGKYEIGRVLGQGGVGIVYEAKNLELDEKVAVKCLRPDMLSDIAMVGRFALEAKAAATIKCEYVASVYDVGTAPGGAPFMVMEFLEGRDLASVTSQSGTLAPRVAAEYTLHVCEALAVAHSMGIVHRDIKPENLMLTERGRGIRIVKVLDFGISKAALSGSIFRNDLPNIKTISLMGTPLYMSPEQVRRSENVDPRSDIWSLGMVLYELLSGCTAFNATTLTELCAAILERAPEPLSTHRDDLPPGLVDVIFKCLEKDPDRRYANVGELAMALMPYAPKRARLNVERAVAVLGAGMGDGPATAFSSVPPPRANAVTLPAVPMMPKLPDLSTTDGGELVRASTLVPVTRPSVPPKWKSPVVLVALVALVAFAIGAARVAGKKTSVEPPVASAAPQPVPEAPPPEAVKVEPAVEPQEAKPAETPTSVKAPAKLHGAAKRAAPSAAPSASAPPARKKAGDFDLGY